MGLTLKPSFLGMASAIPYSHGSSCNAKAWHWVITAGLLDKRNGVQRHFARQYLCDGNCGTPLYACAVDDPQSYTLRLVPSLSVRPFYRCGKSGDALLFLLCQRLRKVLAVINVTALCR